MKLEQNKEVIVERIENDGYAGTTVAKSNEAIRAEIIASLDDQGDLKEVIQKVIEKEKDDTDNYYVIWADKEGLVIEGYLTEDFAIQKYLEVSSKVSEEKGPVIIKGKQAGVEIVTKLSF